MVHYYFKNTCWTFSLDTFFCYAIPTSRRDVCHGVQMFNRVSVCCQCRQTICSSPFVRWLAAFKSAPLGQAQRTSIPHFYRTLYDGFNETSQIVGKKERKKLMTCHAPIIIVVRRGFVAHGVWLSRFLRYALSVTHEIKWKLM